MSDLIDETLFDAEEKMEKAVAVAKDDLATLRTGRANPNTFGRIVIDYYGAPTQLPNMASITIPEARMAVIKPYDISQLNAIEKAIRDSDLGVNPSNDGHILRIIFPQLTEERRRNWARRHEPRVRTRRSPSATSGARRKRASTRPSKTATPARTRVRGPRRSCRS